MVPDEGVEACYENGVIDVSKAVLRLRRIEGEVIGDLEESSFVLERKGPIFTMLNPKPLNFFAFYYYLEKLLKYFNEPIYIDKL